MTATVKTAIDNKINQLGERKCRKFLEAVEPTMAYAKDYRRAVRSELAAENWEDLTNLFLSWK